MKMFSRVVPDLCRSRDVEKTINYLLRHQVQDPGINHAIASIASSIEQIISCRLRNTTVNEVCFVLGYESHQHRPTPCVVLGAMKRMGNQNKPWTVSIMEKKMDWKDLPL